MMFGIFFDAPRKIAKRNRWDASKRWYAARIIGRDPSDGTDEALLERTRELRDGGRI